MRAIHRSVCTLATLALVSGTASAQGRREARPIEASLERTADAIAAAIEQNVERWAETVERNAERWAEQIERHAEALANSVEARLEARVGAGEQVSERERELRERQRELERQQREIEREIQQQRREAQREQQQRQREQQQQQQQRGNRGNDRRDGPEATEQFSRTVSLGRTGIVSLDNLAGDVVITGGSGIDVRVDATKRARERSDEAAKARLNELQIEVESRAGRVDIRTTFGGGRNRFGASSEVDYTLAVPSGADLVVKTQSGDVRVSNVKGELRVETISGDLTINGAGPVRTAKTFSGDIEIANADGDVAAGTISGDIVMRALKGRSLTVNALSGDVQLTDADFERADVGSQNGDIVYAGRLAKGGHYDFHTHSGNVRVIPSNDPGLDVNAETFNGNIVSDFTLKMSPQIGRGFAGRTNRRVRGTYGDGGATLSLRSFNGDITIARR